MRPLASGHRDAVARPEHHHLPGFEVLARDRDAAVLVVVLHRDSLVRWPGSSSCASTSSCGQWSQPLRFSRTVPKNPNELKSPHIGEP